jgi:modulator of FtsH protease HflC
MRTFLSVLLIGLGIAAAVVYTSAFIVRQNQQALVFEFGRFSRLETEPGLKFLIPIVETVRFFDRRIVDLDTQPRPVIASDQKQLMVDTFVRFRIDNALTFYQKLRTESNAESQIVNSLESSMRSVLGNATFLDIVKNRREELMGLITEQLKRQAKEFGVEIIDVRIKRADLPQQNRESVFQRMKTERQREAADFRAQGEEQARRIKATADRQATVIRAEASRKGEILRGEGDGERNTIFASAYNRDPDFFAFYRSMQAYENSFKAGDTRLLLAPDSEFFRYFNDPNGKSLPTGAKIGAPSP